MSERTVWRVKRESGQMTDHVTKLAAMHVLAQTKGVLSRVTIRTKPKGEEGRTPISADEVEREAERLFNVYQNTPPRSSHEWHEINWGPQNGWRAVAEDKLEAVETRRAAQAHQSAAVVELLVKERDDLRAKLATLGSEPLRAERDQWCDLANGEQKLAIEARHEVENLKRRLAALEQVNASLGRELEQCKAALYDVTTRYSAHVLEPHPSVMQLSTDDSVRLLTQKIASLEANIAATERLVDALAWTEAQKETIRLMLCKVAPAKKETE